MFEILILLIFPGAMALAAASDLITMTISNWISIALVAGFALLSVWAGLGWLDIGLHLAVGLTALMVGFGCFAFGWIGGGDAKLFAASALWFGWPGVFEYAIIAAFLGGGLTMGLLFIQRVPIADVVGRHTWIGRLHSLENGVPYGLALAVAGLMVYPHSIWMTELLG